MDQLRQEGSMQERAKLECWSRAPEATPKGPWLMSHVDSAEHAIGLDARMAWLLHTIEAEIIPRLMHSLATEAFDADPRRAVSPLIGPSDVPEFATLTFTQPTEAALAHIEARRAQGLGLDEIYLNLLAPAARHLGELWEADLCDFTQVTLGLWRLQQVMHKLSPAFQNGAAPCPQRRRALLAPAPGSQHTLGLFMVTEFFRRAGWEVWGDPMSSMADLAATVRAEWFDVVGFSVGAECQVEALSAAITAMRTASLNQAIVVMVGGQLLALHPELVDAVGADATAADARQAIVQAEHLVSQREKRRVEPD